MGIKYHGSLFPLGRESLGGVPALSSFWQASLPAGAEMGDTLGSWRSYSKKKYAKEAFASMPRDLGSRSRWSREVSALPRASVSSFLKWWCWQHSVLLQKSVVSADYVEWLALHALNRGILTRKSSLALGVVERDTWLPRKPWKLWMQFAFHHFHPQCFHRLCLHSFLYSQGGSICIWSSNYVVLSKERKRKGDSEMKGAMENERYWERQTDFCICFEILRN